ncbi:MAG: Gfo/Idh/MocA family oxidoreductase [Spirochaetales bacterium]|jgi:predicted dehydrogenase|nr:Gfo/Idh/MocA family oxidoreductase [Spirochaetales bacterium]
MPLKVGVVGYRGIGQRHAECHAEDPLAELVGVCDVVKERADVAREKHGVDVYYSLQDMLKDHPEIDIIDVCTGGDENGGWHFEPTMEALDAGKHVLCEKPISNRIEHARQMVDFAARQGRYLGCNLNHYFTKPAYQADQLIKDGKIGEKLYCLHRMGFPGGEFTYDGIGDAPNSKGFPYFHVKAFLAHPFSIMRHFCGDITHVQAFMNRPSFRRAAEDPMVSVNSIHVKFANDTVGYLFSQRGDARMGYGGWWSVEVGGTKGSFAIENCVEKLIYYPSPGAEGAADPANLGLGAAPDAEVTETGDTDFGITFPNRIHAFLEDVTNKVPFHQLRASGRDALATLEYTFAAIESFESGGALVRPHRLPPFQRDAKQQIQ